MMCQSVVDWLHIEKESIQITLVWDFSDSPNVRNGLDDRSCSILQATANK